LLVVIKDTDSNSDTDTGIKDTVSCDMGSDSYTSNYTRYTARYRLNKKFHDVRVDKLVEFLRWQGLFPVSYPHNSQGVDIMVLSGKPFKPIIEVLEVTNYRRSSYVHKDRLARYITCLNVYDVVFPNPTPLKTLVVSYLSNLTKLQRDLLESHHINVWVLGFQHVPEGLSPIILGKQRNEKLESD